MILDTNALSDLSAGNTKLMGHLRSSRTHSIPAVVLGEYRFGILGSKSKDERTRWLAKLESQLEILDVTAKTAVFYAEVRHDLRQIGKPIPENDVWIAALAREHGLSVLSRDSHFDHVPGITRVGW